MVQKGGVKSLLMLLTKSVDNDAQRFAALALGNAASACKQIDFCSLFIISYLFSKFEQLSIVLVWLVKVQLQ